ncbi:MAG: aminoacyl-tRNA hydrolase [Actinobacteria bacterium]|nr:aminoacyl-tRNA hydrolase [Actinomycetota bacterium]MBI3256500.1 aminoacyl-tRNA hydrolase [Actinomycetota bacterium]
MVMGLGNPGDTYVGTRHNIGAETVGVLAARHGVKLAATRCRALAGEARIGGKRIVLAFPLTFYNEAGNALVALARRYGIDDPRQVVVVHDELDLLPGTLKVKVGGGLAGNNGLKSIKAHLHSEDFIRVRIGVGKPPGREQGVDHVLRRPGKAERVELDVVIEKAADAVEAIAVEGPDVAMNRFN